MILILIICLARGLALVRASQYTFKSGTVLFDWHIPPPTFLSQLIFLF